MYFSMQNKLYFLAIMSIPESAIQGHILEMRTIWRASSGHEAPDLRNGIVSFIWRSLASAGSHLAAISHHIWPESIFTGTYLSSGCFENILDYSRLSYLA